MAKFIELCGELEALCSSRDCKSCNISIPKTSKYFGNYTLCPFLGKKPRKWEEGDFPDTAPMPLILDVKAACSAQKCTSCPLKIEGRKGRTIECIFEAAVPEFLFVETEEGNAVKTAYAKISRDLRRLRIEYGLASEEERNDYEMGDA